MDMTHLQQNLWLSGEHALAKERLIFQGKTIKWLYHLTRTYNGTFRFRSMLFCNHLYGYCTH